MRVFSVLLGLFLAVPAYAAIDFTPNSPSDIADANSVDVSCDGGNLLYAYTSGDVYQGGVACPGDLSGFGFTVPDTYTFIECLTDLDCGSNPPSQADAEVLPGYISTSYYTFDEEEEEATTTPSSGTFVPDPAGFVVSVVFLWLTIVAMIAIMVRGFSL